MGLCQLVCARHPERIGRLVLTNCDAFESFPPRAVRPLIAALKQPIALQLLATAGRLRPVRRAALAGMPLTMTPIPDAQLKRWMTPLSDPAIRRDMVKFARGVSPELTQSAAERLRDFDRPALIAWGTRDKLFKPSLGERLAQTLPNAELHRIDDARTFVQLDAPSQLADLIEAFALTKTTA